MKKQLITGIEYQNKGIVKFRKSNFWRGFCACLFFIVIPLVAGIIILLNIFINIYGN